MTTRNYMDVEDLDVYKKLCRLHIEVCDLAHKWPQERERRWQVAEESAEYGVNDEPLPQGWPIAEE